MTGERGKRSTLFFWFSKDYTEDECTHDMYTPTQHPSGAGEPHLHQEIYLPITWPWLTSLSMYALWSFQALAD